MAGWACLSIDQLTPWLPVIGPVILITIQSLFLMQAGQAWSRSLI
jgi:hypothetical protein